MFDLKFNDNSADDVVKEYRSTIAFAKLTDADKVEHITEDEEDETPLSDNSMPPTQSPPPPPSPAVKAVGPVPPAPISGLMDFPVPLPSGVVAYYRLPPTLSEADFAFYQTLLHAYKPGLVKGSEQFPKDAAWKSKDGNKLVKIMGVMGIAPNGVKFYSSEDGTGLPETELEFI